MCYSALVKEDWRSFVRETGIRLDIPDFVRLFVRRADEGDKAFRIPRGIERELLRQTGPEADKVRDLIEQHRKQKTAELEAALFELRRRIADADRKLAAKETKAASESKRIASGKLTQALNKLAMLNDGSAHRGDYRIFPLYFAPVLVGDAEGVRMIPARYQLRPPGKPASIDRQLSLFNARRDNLGSPIWRPLFGTSHAILPASSFFENVEDAEGQSRRIQFIPDSGATMYIACLFAEWVNPAKPADTLASFAAVTDDPPPEVLAAGHDRVPISLTWEAAQQWLSPQGRSVEQLQALLDEGRQRPTYEHRAAA